MKQPVTTKERLVLVIGTAFGLGLAPVAPGSFAALLGLAVHALVWFFAPAALRYPLLAAAFALFTALHFWLNDTAAAYWADTDSGNFVLDEVAGYLVTALIILPLQVYFPRPLHNLAFMTVGFVLFRVLDIIKLPPARQIDRDMHNAWGVILDDYVSAAYAGGLCWLAHAFHAF